MLFGKIFYMIHRTISVRFLRDTIRSKTFFWHEKTENRGLSPLFSLSEKGKKNATVFGGGFVFIIFMEDFIPFLLGVPGTI